MREDVLILLNERESSKLLQAEQLEEQLQSRGLSVSRIAPQASVAAIINERRPRVLVIDYLLGDFGTAMDVLDDLRPELDIASILWTDESSAHVAVSAMRSGARNYFEIGSPRSLEKVTTEIQELLAEKENQTPKHSPSSRYPSLPTIPAHSPAARQMLAQAKAAILRSDKVIVLQGERGTGRSTLAQWIHSSRPFAGAFHEIDFDLYSDELTRIFGEITRHPHALLRYQASVMIDHAEFDDGSLLASAEEWLPRAEENSLLIVGTDCAQTSQAWTRLCHASVLEIPALSERYEDSIPLLQLATKSIEKKFRRQEIDCSPELVAAITALPWPGNVKQLLAALTDVMTMEIEDFEDLLPAVPEELVPKLSSATAALQFRVLLWSKALWEKNASSAERSICALECKSAMVRASGNERIAAALLGVSVPAVRGTLSACSKGENA